MLAHHLRHRARERRLPGEHVPERDAERIDVRADVDLALFELLRAGKMRRADEAALRDGGRVLRAGRERFREAEVDHFHRQLIVLADEHEIRRFDVAMDEPVNLRGIERPCHLIHDLQCEQRRERTLPFNQSVHRFPVDELHRVKHRLAFRREMEHRRDVPVPQLRRRASLTDKALPGDVAVEELAS